VKKSDSHVSSDEKPADCGRQRHRRHRAWNDARPAARDGRMSVGTRGLRQGCGSDPLPSFQKMRGGEMQQRHGDRFMWDILDQTAEPLRVAGRLCLCIAMPTGQRPLCKRSAAIAKYRARGPNGRLPQCQASLRERPCYVLGRRTAQRPCR
jgi:hypothetical protein